ncbi:hypothetical protein LCGC14_2346160 [marine sediment metagenome]|uniref:Uncharacterized protein n=1 Tax=marine sediment metagenome TaxID=412755 RepID=A0A0F9CBE6_9ZZZZ
MSSNLISATRCLYNAKHRWKYIADAESKSMAQRKISWCNRCGALTEFYKIGRRWRRATADDGKGPYVLIPDILKRT